MVALGKRPGRRSVPRGAVGQPLPGSGAPPRAELDPRPPRTQEGSAVSDPQADADRHRAPGGARAWSGYSSAFAWAIPTRRCSGPGWPRSQCDVYLAHDPADPSFSSTRPSRAVPPTRSMRSARRGGRSRGGAPRSSTTHERRPQGADRGAEPPDQEGQARRPRVPFLPRLPATDPPPCRRRQLARPATPGALHPNPFATLKPGPVCQRVQSPGPPSVLLVRASGSNAAVGWRPWTPHAVCCTVRRPCLDRKGSLPCIRHST